MRHSTLRPFAVLSGLALAAGLTVAVAPANAAEAQEPTASGFGSGALKSAAAERAAIRKSLKKSGRQTFLLRLDARSTQASYLASMVRGKSAARNAAKAQLATVKAAQAEVVRELPARTKVLYRSHSLVSAVAVNANVTNFDELNEIPGVAAVYPIASKRPDNSSAGQLVGAPSAWQDYGARGAGTTIAIIDSGIDYTHADFGGPGTPQAFQDAFAASAQPANPALFPNSKVVGGYDLVGDDYDADADPYEDPAAANPAPDPNPLDCDGHGTHVAGTAAGLGVAEDGSTYAGPYDASTDLDAMRIGPGIAPEADLLAIRVFGCAGSSDVIGAAMDLAADPNGDGDPSDAADVINLSLGADFASALDGDALYVKNAVALGINVVVASGNAGDLYEVGGAPGNVREALTVANSVDSTAVFDKLNISGLPNSGFAASRSALYDWSTGDDLAGELVALPEPDNRTACEPLNGDDAAAVAGKVAFVEWHHEAVDLGEECGSIQRGNNLAEAGAIGFVFANDESPMSQSISGSDTIPGVLLDGDAADEVRAHLDEGLTVTSTEANGFTMVDEDLVDTLDNSSSRGWRDAGAVKPDVAGIGSTVFSAAVGTGADGISNSGTSMATPQVAGLAALIAGKRPSWTPEFVKASIMNTAGADLTPSVDSVHRYGPNRVGAGRIIAESAVGNEVVAYVADDPGAVSASFGPIEVTRSETRSKTINVRNLGSSAATYDVEYEAINALPGATYSVQPASITVGAGQTKTVKLTLSLNPAALTKRIDPTMSRTPIGDITREFTTQADGRVLFSSEDQGSLRVPVYASPRPASAMRGPDAVRFASGAQQGADLRLSGDSVDQGADQTAIQSLGAGFELGVRSGNAPACASASQWLCVPNLDARAADLRMVGATSDYPYWVDQGADEPEDAAALHFAVNTRSSWRTPATTQEFDINIDVDGDGWADYLIYNDRAGLNDVMAAITLDVNDPDWAVVDAQPINYRPTGGSLDTALMDSDTMVLSVALAALDGVDPANPKVSYSVVSYFQQDYERPVDAVGGAEEDPFYVDGSLSVNAFAPAISVWGASNLDNNPLLFADTPASDVQVHLDRDSYGAGPGLGLMLVHFHNRVGDKVDVVDIERDIELSVSPAAPTVGKKTTVSVLVRDNGVVAPSGQVTLRDGTGAVLGKANTALDGNGIARITFTPTVKGELVVRADYSGDTNYPQAESDPLTLNVAGVAVKPTLKVPAKLAAGKKGQATVTVPANGQGTPTGTVFLRTGSGKLLGSKKLSGGTAKIGFKFAKSGSYKLKVVYGGNTKYAQATSATKTVKVTKNAAKLTVSLPKSAKKGSQVKATVTVKKINGLTPTGKITLTRGGKTLGSGMLKAGKATITFRPDARGKITVTARYAGNAAFKAGSAGKALRVT